MPGKYQLSKEDYKYLFSVIDMECKGKYDAIYQSLGCENVRANSYHCINSSAHSLGRDANPSFTIDPETGMYHCFACGIKGNLATFYKEFVVGTSYDKNSGSYSSFMIDYLQLDRFINLGSNPADEKTRMEVKALYEKINGEVIKSSGKPYVMSDAVKQEVKKEVKKEMYLETAMNDGYVDALMANEELKKFLLESRNLKEEHIVKYRIGYDGHGITFPMISVDGDLLNVKRYTPWSVKRAGKWVFPFTGYDTSPSPMTNFFQNKIYICEGEPDAYCAIAFGLNAVTLGSAANVDVNRIFGEKFASELLNGKEVVIVCDADTAGTAAANKIAASVYPYARQVKIIDLNKRDDNPNGLDPEAMKTVEGKEVRAEKDFTEFLKKNGFNESALKMFLELEQHTGVYNDNSDRREKQVFKVTLQEARHSRYYSDDGMIELDLVAAVGDLDCDSLKYTKTVEVKCKFMGKEDCGKACKFCSLKEMPGFESVDRMTFKFDKEKDPKDPFSIKVKEHDIFGLIETTDDKKNLQKKRLLGIFEKCTNVVLTDKIVNGLVRVRLVRDMSEGLDSTNGADAAASEIDMEAYMLEKDIYPNKSYRFRAVQTTAWNGQHAVLFCYSAQPIATSIDTFVMNDDIDDTLQIFKQKEDETIQQAIDRRYHVFSNASGINGREDVFFCMDLSYFSAIEIDNKVILPSIKRGWVEVLIAGQSRCGKTVVAKFLNNHYKIGEFIGGSNAVGRTGLLGGIEYVRKKGTIRWGKFPMNDGGIVTLDELSIIDENTLDSLTSMRSDGEADIVKQKSGKTKCRVRKIMLSNKRTTAHAAYNSDNAEEGGIEMLKKLCFYKDHILSRFDLAYIVASDDVAEFSASYSQLSTEFTQYQCQTLIKWAYSRKSSDVVFEPGFEIALNEAQNKMLEKFHSSTQLVNQEMRAKLARLSISLATMLYSTVPGDNTKIFVKKEYVKFMMDFLTRIYCSKNMYLDRTSAIAKASECLGNMDVMMNMLKYIDITMFMRYGEFSTDDIKVIFASVFARINKGTLFIIDSVTGERTNKQYINDIVPLLMNLLLSRNCIVKVNNKKYQKTDRFHTWISDRLKDIQEGRDVEQSNVLEPESNVTNIELGQKIASIDPSDWKFRKQ